MKDDGVRTRAMNFRTTDRMSSDIVAENIITCFFRGHLMKIVCISFRISACRNALTTLKIGRGQDNHD
jgi:hypothetical protein